MVGSTRVARSGVRFVVGAALVLAVTGCGAVVTAGIAGGVFALGGKGGKRGGQAPSQINSAAVVGDTSTGTVEFDFTVSNAASLSANVEIRYSVTPSGGTEDDSSQPFPSRALSGTSPSPAGLATAASGTNAVANDASLATSSGGTAYTFLWNTSQDLGTFGYTNAVRLQILLDGQVAFTTSPFTVDNTRAPQVISVALPSLPQGATLYADNQGQNQGGIRTSVVLADADASNVALSVLYSTDGGATFPATNIAAGELVDPSNGAIVPISSVTTTSGGKSYVFRFRSASNGLGALTPTTNVALQFTVQTTKVGTSKATSVFGVDNASFSAALSTPSSSQISDAVTLGYLLSEAAAQPLDIVVEFSLDGGNTFATATELRQPPSEGTQSLFTTSQGAAHTFVWNAYQDVLQARGTVANSSVVLRIIPIRRSTQTATGPFRTKPFSLDERLIFTIFNSEAGVVDQISPTIAQLVNPAGVAVLSGNLYFADTGTNRIRVVPLQGGGSIDTFMGGGTATKDGALAREFALIAPGDIAADPGSPGALFVCGSSNGDISLGVPSARIFRVDGSTPIVTTLVDGSANDVPYAVTFEPLTRVVYYANFVGPAPGFSQLCSIPSSGGTATVLGGVAAGSTADGPLSNAIMTPIGVAANFNVYPGLVFFTESTPSGRVRVANVTNVAQSFGTTSVPGLGVVTLTSAIAQPVGLSLEGRDGLDVTDVETETIYRLRGDGTIFAVCGSQTRGFNGDQPVAATSARLLSPTRICGDLKASDAQHPSTGFYFTDVGNVRVRALNVGAVSTLVTTIAGTTRDMGDQLPSATAELDHPTSVAVSGQALVVADTFVSRIRTVAPQSTIMSTLAGNGTSGVAGDNGPAFQATVGNPVGLVVAGVNSGSIYFTQPADSVVRKLVQQGAPGAIVQHVAGVAGSPGAPVDGQLAANERLSSPRALAAASGCIVVADAGGGSGVLYAINDGAAPATCANVTVAPGTIRRIAGGGALPASNGAPALTAQFGSTIGVVADRTGALYVADVTSHAVWHVSAAGVLTRIAGQPGTPGSFGDGLPATLSRLTSPSAVALDEPSESILYILDSGDDAVRAVNLTGAPVAPHGRAIAAGCIDTVAGKGTNGFSGDGGDALAAKLDLKSTLIGGNFAVIDSTSGAFLTFPDVNNDRVRFVDPAGTIRTLAGGGTLDGDATALQPAKSPENSTLSRPTALGVGSNGAYYVVDLGRVRGVTSDNATQTRVVGTAQMFPGPDGVALNTELAYTETANTMADITSDLNGVRQVSVGSLRGTPVLLIAETLASSVRIVNLASSGAVTPNGMAPIPPGSIATVPFPLATLSYPSGIALTSSGVLVVADTGHDRLVAANVGAPGSIVVCGTTLNPGDYSGQVIASMAGGTCPSAPQNVAIDASANVAIVMGLGGSGPGPSAPGPYAISLGGTALVRWGTTIPASGAAALPTPSLGGPASRGGAIDAANGDYYYVDRANHVVIRLAADGSAQEIVAGSAGKNGFDGDGGLAVQALLRSPIAVGVDGRSSIYVLDAGNLRVRRFRRFP